MVMGLSWELKWVGEWNWNGNELGMAIQMGLRMDWNRTRLVSVEWNSNEMGFD